MLERSPRVTRKPFIVAGGMLGMFMVAVESTIVATAMPSIAAELGDFALYGWVFAGYLIAQASTVMIFGKLADLFGRRPVILTGLAISLTGAVLCGLAWSMPVLIAFRVLQGIGSATIQPIVNTVIGDLYAPEERPKIQSWLTSVWIVAAVAGPLVGGIIVQNFSWEWVFWVNLPIGLTTMALFAFYLREDIEPKQRSIDYLGSVLFCIAIVGLLVAMSQSNPSWTSPLTVGCVVAFIVAVPLLVWQERRAAEPVVAFEFWRDPLVGMCNLAILVGSAVMIAITAYQPVFVQGVLGRSALIAGISLFGAVVSWSIATYTIHFLLPRLDTRGILRLGAACLIAGGIGFLFLTPQLGWITAVAIGSFTGFGMGLMNFICMLLIQTSVPWSQRATATSTFMLARMLGSAAGVALLGAVLNQTIFRNGGAGAVEEVRALLMRKGEAIVVADPALRALLERALDNVFTGIFLMSVATAAACLVVPSKPMSVLSAAHRQAGQPAKEA